MNHKGFISHSFVGGGDINDDNVTDTAKHSVANNGSIQ
jgi:hypothetical protein